jgi:hypothetical protein
LAFEYVKEADAVRFEVAEINSNVVRSVLIPWPEVKAAYKHVTGPAEDAKPAPEKAKKGEK